MVKYTCLYYSLIQSGLEFRGEERGEALGVGKFSTLSYRGHSAGELGLYYSPTRDAPLPRPSLGRIGWRGRGDGSGEGRDGPGRDPGIWPAGRRRAGQGKEGMEWKRKERQTKVRGEMVSQCLASWQALLYKIQSLFFMRNKLSK